MPTISVIVPVYKVEKYLHRCVDSILAQTFTDFELILVDDGSPDGCPQICDEYAEKDPRIKVIHQKNGGLSAARNAGLDRIFENSDSEWVAFIDSDDWVHPEYLERLLFAAKESRTETAVCGFEITHGENPEIKGEDLDVQVMSTEELYVEHTIPAIVAWGKIYRKECFEKLRYPVGKQHEDEFTTHKALFMFEQTAYIAAPLYAYFYNEEGIMNTSGIIKRLDGTDAIEEQVAFFQEKGLDKAYKKALERLASSHCILYGMAKEKNLDEERKIIKKRVREVIKKYPLKFGENKPIFEAAYPKLMWCYWTYIGVTNKIRRMLKNACS